MSITDDDLNKISALTTSSVAAAFHQAIQQGNTRPAPTMLAGAS